MENEIKSYLKLHLGVLDSDIKQDLDEYENEWMVLEKPVEILPFKEARDNEVEDYKLANFDIPCEWFNMFSDTKNIGRYTKLGESDYYLRWL